ncbi:MAG: hydrogenase maturation nickel metallochaperone HypA [Fuerstia sp.]|nr:hydrogenase maturation nickel metallochaperone HypA [Fuerstiella sp.]
MHEESLIRSLLRQVEELAQQHHAIAVEDIEVEVGPLSGVEPLLLQDAFERLRAQFLWPQADLSVLQVGLDVRCRNCGTESQLQDFRFMCHECGSTSLQIVRGDACRLLNVRIQIDDAVTA